MENVTKKVVDGRNVVALKGRIDSSNVAQIEEAIGVLEAPIVIDLEELEYTSSAGLRLILKIKKAYGDVKVINARSEVYEVFEMTGFTEMMEIHKAYRKVSVDGCEAIGKGANGIVYRLDPDTVVKVYLNDDSLSEIQHEREMAKIAFVLGIPTAMSYDVVKVGDHYASMFEMINAKSFGTLLAEPNPDIDGLAKEYSDLMKLIHRTSVPKGQLPSKKEKERKCFLSLAKQIPEESYDKLIAIFNAIPDSDTMLHCDFHVKNLMMTKDGVVLIDMDTIATGDPIFEWGSLWNSYIGYGVNNPMDAAEFFGVPYEVLEEFRKKTFALYFESDDPDYLAEKEREAAIIGLPHAIDHFMRHGKKMEAELSIRRLLALLDQA